MFLTESSQKHPGQRRVSGREESRVEQAMRVGVDCRKQPVALVIPRITVSSTAT